MCIYRYIYTLNTKCISKKNMLDAKTKDNTRLCGHYNDATTFMLKNKYPICVQPTDLFGHVIGGR